MVLLDAVEGGIGVPPSERKLTLGTGEIWDDRLMTVSVTANIGRVTEFVELNVVDGGGQTSHAVGEDQVIEGIQFPTYGYEVIRFTTELLE